jgi:hypothetical protein
MVALRSGDGNEAGPVNWLPSEVTEMGEMVRGCGEYFCSSKEPAMFTHVKSGGRDTQWENVATRCPLFEGSLR